MAHTEGSRVIRLTHMQQSIHNVARLLNTAPMIFVTIVRNDNKLRRNDQTYLKLLKLLYTR